MMLVTLLFCIQFASAGNYILNESFEDSGIGCGEGTVWTAIAPGSLTQDGAIVHSGSFSCRVNSLSSGAYVTTVANMSQGNITCAVWQYVPTASSVTGYTGMSATTAGDVNIAYRNVLSTTNWSVSTTYPSFTANGSIVKNQWQRTAMYAQGNGTWLLYGNVTFRDGDLLLEGAQTSTFETLSIGQSSGTTTGVFYYDDVTCWEGNLFEEPLNVSFDIAFLEQPSNKVYTIYHDGGNYQIYPNITWFWNVSNNISVVNNSLYTYHEFDNILFTLINNTADNNYTYTNNSLPQFTNDGNYFYYLNSSDENGSMTSIFGNGTFTICENSYIQQISGCVNGIQNITYIDFNSCPVEFGKPAGFSQVCGGGGTGGNTTITFPNAFIFTFTEIDFIFLAMIVLLIFFPFYMNDKRYMMLYMIAGTILLIYRIYVANKLNALNPDNTYFVYIIKILLGIIALVFIFIGIMAMINYFFGNDDKKKKK